jgi:hypothetical protein
VLLHDGATARTASPAKETAIEDFARRSMKVRELDPKSGAGATQKGIGNVHFFGMVTDEGAGVISRGP